ncbi:MAG: TatD family hydrolase, partial [Spirochaetales bacterium]|nr:TatD family hydrolase [Spirochaetales bacterium]
LEMNQISEILLQDSHLHIDSGNVLNFNGVSHKLGRLFINSTSTFDMTTVRLNKVFSPEVIPFFGVHPWFVKKEDDIDFIMKKLILNIETFSNSGIGECGLDFSSKYKDTKNIQITLFNEQVHLALSKRRPLSIHCIKAWDELFKILDNFNFKSSSFLIHSFYGSIETMKRIIKLGGFISISAKSFINPEKSEKVIKAIPSERLLIETDLTLNNCDDSMKIYINELEENYKTVANIRGIDFNKLAQQVWNNGKVFTN